MKKERELLEFQVLRTIVNLYKGFLLTIEDLNKDHKMQFDKLKQSIPEHEDLLRQAEYLDEAQLNYLRKKILDNGNDARRELMSYMENFDINFIEVDAEKDTSLAKDFKIDSYPAIKLFRNDKIYNYDAKPNSNHLMDFLKGSLQ